MGPGTKAKKEKRSEVVVKVGELTNGLKGTGEESDKETARKIQNQRDGGWKQKEEIVVPVSQKKELEALVAALRAEGYDVRSRPMKATKWLPEEVAKKSVVFVITGEGLDASAQRPAAIPAKTEAPQLLTEIDRNLLYPYFHKNDKELTPEEKMGLLEGTARTINEKSSQSDLQLFDLFYRGVQDVLMQKPPGVEKLKKRFGRLVPLHGKVINKITDPDRDAGLPAPPETVPVKMPPPKTAARKPEDEKVAKLRTLLSMGELPSDDLKQAHIVKLYKIYADPGFRRTILAKYKELERLLIRASALKDLDRSAQSRMELTRKIKELESAVTLYKETYRQLKSMHRALYKSASGRKAKEEVEGRWKGIVDLSANVLGPEAHKELLKYTSSQTALFNELGALKLSKAQSAPIYTYLNMSLKPDYSPRAQIVDLGTGAAAKKKAEALAETLRKYPQLIFVGNTVRVAKYYSKGKEFWTVEIGTVEECAKRRAVDLIAEGTNVPLKGEDFKGELAGLLAKRLGDSNMDSKPYAKAYEDIRVMGTGTQQRYNITFPNKVAAGEFYSLIVGLGPAHGFSALSDIQKTEEGWVVSVKCPTGEVAAPVKEEVVEAPKPPAPAEEEAAAEPAQTRKEAAPDTQFALPDNTPSSLVLEQKTAQGEKPQASTEPVEGTKDLGLSQRVITWMNLQTMSPTKFLRLRKGQVDKYNKLNQGQLDLKGWRALLVPAEACANLSEVHLAAVEANKEAFKEYFGETETLKPKEYRKELKAYSAYVAHVKKLYQRDLKDLEEVKAKINYLENASPDKVDQIPAAIDGMSAHMPAGERTAMVTAYKTPGASRSYEFENSRHAGRVHTWLIETNFEHDRVYLSGNTITVHGPPEKEAEFTMEPAPDMEFRPEEAAARTQTIQDMVESIYGWADPEANTFLQDTSRTNDAGKTHQQVLENFAAQISEDQLKIVLEYLRYEVYLLANGMPSSGEPLRLTVSNTADSTEVMEGIRLLYVAAGLDSPRFHPVIINRSQGGNQRITVRGLPRAYKPPSKEIILPEPKEGKVFVQGQWVRLSVEEKQEIEKALRNGEAFNVIIYKDEDRKQVDTRGAYFLMQYLQTRGWSNVSVQPWNPPKFPARAALSAHAVPAGHWKRPSIISVVKGRNLLLDMDALAKLAEEREEIAESEFWRTAEGEKAKFIVPGDGVVSMGGIRVSIIDHIGEELAALKAAGDKVGQKHVRLEEERIEGQREELERVANTPGAVCRIRYRGGEGSLKRAAAAAKVLQHWLRSQGDMRAVKVEKGAVFRRIPYTRNYYLVVGKAPTNAFEQRHTASVQVPINYKYYSSALGREVSRPLLTTMDCVHLELFLNGSGGGAADFYTTTEGEEGLRAYLRDIGFDSENVYTTALKGASEIPAEYRAPKSEAQRELDGLAPAGPAPKYVHVRLVMPKEEAMPAEVSQDSTQVKYTELTNTLYGTGDDDFKKYNNRYPRRVRALLQYARHPKLIRKDWVIKFGREDGGSEMAEKMFFALKSSGLFPGVELDEKRENWLIIRAPPEEEQAPMGRRGEHRARMEHAAEITHVLLSSMLPEAQRQSREFTSNLFKTEEGDEYNVSFVVGEEPVPAIDAFTNRMSAGKDTSPFSLAYGLFSDSMQHYIFNMYTSENKTAYAIELSNLDMKQSEEKAAEFDPGPSIAIMQGFMRMHAGVEYRKNWKARLPRYVKRAPQMFEVLSKYKRFEDFAAEIKATGSSFGFGALAAIHQYSTIMTNLVVSNNTSYDTWGKPKQKAFRSAVFNVMWRTIVANYLSESGPVLGYPPLVGNKKEREQKKAAMYNEYRGLMIEYFAGTGEHSKFDYKDEKTGEERKYYVLQSLVVRNVTGENLLCVPHERSAKDVVLAVKGRELRRTENGNFVWEIIDIPDRREKLNIYSSLGGLGVTGSHSGPVFQPDGEVTVEEEPEPTTPGGPPPEEPEYVKTTIGTALMPIAPVTHVGPIHLPAATEAVWKYRKRRSPIVMGMAVSKEVLFKNVKDPRLGTLVTDKKTITLKGGEKKKITFILPPRHRYDKKGKLREAFDYPCNVFRGRYASAYVWNNSVFVIDYINPKDAPADPLEDVPQNAHRLYSATNAELKEKGFRRINIGRFDKHTGTIAFSKEEYRKEYARHFFGQIRLSSSMLKELKGKDSERFFEGSIAERQPGYHYYSFVPPGEGERDTGASEDVIGSPERLLYLHKTPVAEGEGGNLPLAIKVGKPKEKKVRKNR